MLHVIVLLAALSSAQGPPVFVPLTTPEPVAHRLPASSVDTGQVAADDGTGEGAGGTVVLENWPHEDGMPCTTTTGSECNRYVANPSTNGFAELRFEVQRR